MHNQQNSLDELVSQSKTSAQESAAQSYHAPQIKIHGKLERLTLQLSSADATATPIPAATDIGEI